MSRAPVTVIVPALGDTDLLDANLPPLVDELERAGAGDELVLVDDTGTGALEAWFAEHLAGRPARLVVQAANGGFAAAVEAGVAAASHDLCFSMNSDVVVTEGFLEPLVAALTGPVPGGIDGGFDAVFAVTPRVLLEGDAERDESFVAGELEGGLLRIRDVDPGPTPTATTPIPFAVGGTCLFDRARFVELGGFDPLFAPFYYEDDDLCWRAWRRGWATLYVPTSVVEHHHRGTIGGLISEDRRRAAVERGELLFNWKHLDAADLPEHLALLYRRALDAWLTDDRAALTWLVAALERAAEAGLERAEDGRPSGEVLDAIQRP